MPEPTTETKTRAGTVERLLAKTPPESHGGVKIAVAGLAGLPLAGLMALAGRLSGSGLAGAVFLAGATALFGWLKVAERRHQAASASRGVASLATGAVYGAGKALLLGVAALSSIFVAASLLPLWIFIVGLSSVVAVTFWTGFMTIPLIYHQADILDLRLSGQLSSRGRQPLAQVSPRPTQAQAPAPAQAAPRKTALDVLGTDLTERARDGKIEPVVGRDEEVEELARVLAQRGMNSALLIGPPGVGKTAIIEGLAQRVVDGRVPPALADREIIALDLSGLIAGTSERGEFEKRLRAVIQEGVASGRRKIIFVDEAHMLMGAGAAQGALDAANMLKPALGRGEITLVLATTLDEAEIVRNDPAFARRLEVIEVPELSVEETIEILERRRPKDEEHHGAEISDEALRAAGQLSDDYVSGYLPDKAIRLVDGACAGARNKARGEGLVHIGAEQIIAKISKESRIGADELHKLLEKAPSQKRRVRHTPTLDKYTRDLIDEARRGRLAPAIGREKEVEEVFDILSKTTKNNVALVGDAGVGKTAVVEGMAHRIADGDVPPAFRDRRIVELDINSLVGGTQWRGMFEDRVKAILDEVRANPDITLFIDEMHGIVGAGATAEGASGLAQTLKPALARGELSVIGATTPDEFKLIQRDSALERRFTPVQVDEPSVEAAIQMLESFCAAKYPDLTITDRAIEAAAILSKRFIPDRRLPDKGIDLLDVAGGRLRNKRSADVELDVDQIIELVAVKTGRSQAELEAVLDAAAPVVAVEVLPE